MMFISIHAISMRLYLHTFYRKLGYSFLLGLTFILSYRQVMRCPYSISQILNKELNTPYCVVEIISSLLSDADHQLANFPLHSSLSRHTQATRHVFIHHRDHCHRGIKFCLWVHSDVPVEQTCHAADVGPASHHGHCGRHGHLGQQGVPDRYYGKLLSPTVTGNLPLCKDHKSIV